MWDWVCQEVKTEHSHHQQKKKCRRYLKNLALEKIRPKKHYQKTWGSQNWTTHCWYARIPRNPKSKRGWLAIFLLKRKWIFCTGHSGHQKSSNQLKENKADLSSQVAQAAVFHRHWAQNQRTKSRRSDSRGFNQEPWDFNDEPQFFYN